MVQQHSLLMPSNKLPKSTRNRPKGLPYYGGPARGSSNKFPAAYYLTARHLNCEYCGHKVYSGSRNTSKVSLMLRHWAHSNACKQIRAASGIVVDQYISEDSLQWEEVPNLDISDEKQDWKFMDKQARLKSRDTSLVGWDNNCRDVELIDLSNCGERDLNALLKIICGMCLVLVRNPDMCR